MAEKLVDLQAPIKVLQEHLTAELCDRAFEKLRTTERVRQWSLDLLVKFWLAVAMHAPPSLRQALAEARLGGSGYPRPPSGDTGFFGRSMSLSWRFFHEVFLRFTASASRSMRQGYEAKLRRRLRAYGRVWVVDGSGLDRVARRLGVLRRVRQVVIPGSVIAYYDLFHGVLRSLDFYERLLGGEASRLRESLTRVPKGTLLLLDRGFSSVRLLVALSDAEVHAVVRLTRAVVAVDDGKRILRRGVTDRLVRLGTRQKGVTPPFVRLIEKLLPDGTKLRLATTVLDRRKLPAELILELYRRRWTVEGMFESLKCVLGLRHMYASSTNAVGMQVYAAAILYNALRIAQGRIAHDHEVSPEDLSVRRLFPRAAVAALKLSVATQIADNLARKSAKYKDALPDIEAACAVHTPLKDLLVRKRLGARRKPTYSKRRALMVSLQKYERRKQPRSRSP
jgi:hypothetical protein